MQAETLDSEKAKKGKFIKMANDNNASNASEFDALPESELEEVVGGAQLFRHVLSGEAIIRTLKPVSPNDFGRVTASLCLLDPPR